MIHLFPGLEAVKANTWANAPHVCLAQDKSAFVLRVFGGHEGLGGRELGFRRR